MGDTPKDVATGKVAGATSVAVATGHYSLAELHDAGAHYVLANLEEPLPGVGGVLTLVSRAAR